MITKVQPSSIVVRNPLNRPPTAAFVGDQVSPASNNPFVQKPTPGPSASAYAATERLEKALQADLTKAEARAELIDAMIGIQALEPGALASLGPAAIDRMFRKLAVVFDTLPDEVAIRDLAAGAVATLGVHLDWRNGGVDVLSALTPETVESYRRLAQHVDGYDQSYGMYKRHASDKTSREHAFEAMATLTDGSAEMKIGLLEAFDLLMGQTRRMQTNGTASSPPSPASSPVEGAATALKDMVLASVAVAESSKRTALEALKAGDLSQSAIMRLQEQLQSANQIITAMNQILQKENELAESLARNVS